MIRQSEIALDTGYNTYRIDGLPPTPIANPGRAALEATANPAQSNAIFFVADGTGGHVFAVDARRAQRQRRALARRSKRSASPPNAPAARHRKLRPLVVEGGAEVGRNGAKSVPGAD